MSEQGIVHSEKETFGKLFEKLMHNKAVTDGAKVLFAHMHWRYGSNKDNHEGRASMAEFMGVSEATITNRIGELEANDWVVTILRGRHERSGNWQSAFYHVFEDQKQCRKFRAAYVATEGEEMRAKPDKVRTRKSRKGIGGNPKFAALTQVEPDNQHNSSFVGGQNSSSARADNLSFDNLDSFDPDSDSVSTDVDSAPINDKAPTEQPSDVKPRTRKPDAIFDTLAELHWNIHDTSQVDKTTAIRINKIKSWLKDNSPGATAETLRSFATWFADETNGLSLPRDVAKFAERFVEFREYCAKRKNGNGHAPVTPMVKMSDLSAGGAS